MTRHSGPALSVGSVGALQSVCGPLADGQNFQAEISPDAVLQMHDVVAFLQFREINVQRRTRGLRVRRFEPARTLDFVTAKNLRVGQLGASRTNAAGIVVE